MKIPHSQPYFDDRDVHNVREALESRYVTYGPRARKFAKIVAGLTGKKWGIPTHSGTDAITAALYLAGVGPGDRIALPSYMCSAPLDSIALLGGIPIPIDIDRRTLSACPKKLSRLTNIKAVIIPHLFGTPARIEECGMSNLIEDCAQTLGTTIGDKPVGAFGRFAICSFYGTKLLTTGHGGMILGNDKDDFERVMKLFMHDKNENWQLHYHYLMSDFNAALGISQVEKLNRFIEERRSIASRYDAVLTGVDRPLKGIYSRYLVETPDADRMIAQFVENEVEAKRPVYKPISMLLGLAENQCPETAWAHRHIVSIPIYPGMPDEHVSRICEILNANRDALSPWPPP